MSTQFVSNWIRLQEHYLNPNPKRHWPRLDEQASLAGEWRTANMLQQVAGDPEKEAAVIIGGFLFQEWGSRRSSSWSDGKVLTYNAYRNILHAMYEGAPYSPAWDPNSTNVLRLADHGFLTKPLIINEEQAMEHFARETALMLMSKAYVKVQFTDALDKNYEEMKDLHERRLALSKNTKAHGMSL